MKWVQTYLTSRTQEVRFSGHTSGKTEVKAGVPQGSVLGPILFIALTSDLVEHLDNCIVKAYADDTQLLVKGRTRQEVKRKLETAIRKAQLWFRENSLQINPTKTEVMILGGGKENERIKVEVEEGANKIGIETVPQIKVLGVIIDEDLSWKSQVKLVKKKASHALRNIARTSKALPTTSKRLLYDALVAPHLSYADIVWDGCRREEETSLQRLHNFAVKIISGNRGHESTSKAMQELGMVPLTEKRQIHHAVFAHKLINGKGPLELRDRLSCVRACQQDQSKLANRLRSRAKMDIQPQQHRTARYEKSTLHRTAKAWNRTDPNSRKTLNSSIFKTSTQREFTRAYWTLQF